MAYTQKNHPYPVTSCGRRRSFMTTKDRIELFDTPMNKLDKKKLKCNKAKRTPSHPTKSHLVKACEGGKEKIIRFGQQGKRVNTLKGTAGKPKKGESARMKAKRKSFKARHAKNIAKGKMSAAWWADKVKW